MIGQLTEALYQRHATLFGKRKRGSNAPTVSEFLETHAGKSASWCRRCFKAYTIVTAADWDQAWDGTGGIEGSSRLRPIRTSPRSSVSKVQQRLDALTDVVRRKEWEYAERMVDDWDTGCPEVVGEKEDGRLGRPLLIPNCLILWAFCAGSNSAAVQRRQERLTRARRPGREQLASWASRWRHERQCGVHSEWFSV